MAFTVVPTVIDGDDLTDDFTLAVKDFRNEVATAYPTTSTTFTPTWTNVTVGDAATNAGRWVRIGPFSIAEYVLVLGSSTAFTASIAVDTPFTVLGTHGGSAVYVDLGVRYWLGSPILVDANTVSFVHSESAGSGLVTGTAPFTWGNGDTFRATVFGLTA